LHICFENIIFFSLDWSDPGLQLSSEIGPNTPFSRVQKNLESPLLLQILPETSSIWAFLALLYRGEVAVAVLQLFRQRFDAFVNKLLMK
jgi:hypothetical protein